MDYWWLTLDVHANSYPNRGTRGGGRGGGGGGLMDGTLHTVFEMLQYFETILTSVEILWSSIQDEVYLIGGGAAGGLWRHQQWSPSWILLRIRNQVKTAKNGDFLCLRWKITKISTLHDFSHKIDFYCWKKLKKHVLSLTNGLTTSHLWHHIF